MRNFIYDIQLGFLAFPLVALLLALPYALYQYRRFGAISVWKTFVVFTFILYCLDVYKRQLYSMCVILSIQPLR